MIGKICKAVTRIFGVAVCSFTCPCLTNHLTVLFSPSNLLALQSAISFGPLKTDKELQHTLLDSSQITAIQGQQKWSSCSSYGLVSFLNVKIKFHLYKKQVIHKSASVILELVRLIILNYI